MAIAASAQTPPPAKGHSAADMADMQTLESLRRQGSELGNPHEVRYFSNFPSQAAAKAAGQDLVKSGFFIVRSESTGAGKPWILILGRKMPLSMENVRAATQAMNSAAAKHGGRYDGWEARPLVARK